MNEIQLARRLDQARALVEEEKYLHAIQVYLRLIIAEPSFLLPYVELASLYADRGQIPASIHLLLRAAEKFPNNPEIVFLLGSYHLRLDKYKEAILLFQKLATRQLPQVHFNMGIAYFYQNKFIEAEEQFRLTMKYDPAFPKINESLGELLVKREAYPEAIEYLKKGIASDPYSAINHYLLGLAYSRIDQWKKAYNEFILSVDLDPDQPTNWQMCGESLMQLKRYPEAEPYLCKALELYPQSVDAMVDLGYVLSRKGESERAMELINRALEVDPVNTRVREARWKLQHQGKQSTK
ncbi:MAG: tetratricopeptide repeat protein [Ignavibacteria bacterium]|nr:tetratricopeptide repeat protein [Ignavibacteria bacterium]